MTHVTALLLGSVLSTLVNLVLFAGLPLLCYCVYQRWRHARSLLESARRAGLQNCERRYIFYSIAVASAGVAVLIVWPPPLALFLHSGSPQRAFSGLGLTGPSILMALLYGVLQTGFSEELLFRGLLAGSLARRLTVARANLAQSLVFLGPHLFLLPGRPELRGLLVCVWAGALVAGWLRMRSGSILGPWLIHAALNVTVCLGVAVRTAG